MAVSAVRTRQTEGASLAASHLARSIRANMCREFGLLQPKWRGQSCSGVLASSAVLAPVGEGPKMGRLTSAPYCRVKWRCVRLPRGHPRPGPQTLRAYCQLSRADLKPNPKGFDPNQLPEERAGGPSCTCVTDTTFVSQSKRRRVEAHCSDKSSCWAHSLCQSQHMSSSGVWNWHESHSLKPTALPVHKGFWAHSNRM